MSDQDQIVEVKGVPLIIKGGDRDIVVKISDLEYCIAAIGKLQPHKAAFHLEQIVPKLPQLRRGSMLKSHEAIKAVRDGRRIARSGWNGKGMFVYRYDVEGFRPVLVMRTASGAHQMGWVFSQDDLFSDDWEIVQ